MAKLYVVGIGPGSREELTLRADRALQSCRVVVGYHVYTDLVREWYADKEFHTTGMTRESERCRAALALAAEGEDVALVCSGDSGIYGMAALVYELRGESDTPEVEVVPGLTAACSGGALLGAPLTRDFAVVSLSDRLTPWEAIEKRLTAAAEADLTLVLYNPASHGRPEHLRRACDVLLRTLPAERICGLVRNIGRAGEKRQLLTLGELRDTEVDMFCTVFIGCSATAVTGGALITSRGYRDV